MGDKARIMNRLMERGTITPLEAIEDFGCTRLSQYIHLLRKDGVHIETEIITGRDRFGEPMHYARYRLEK